MDSIVCELHGEQDETFVCIHLAESLESGLKVGFYYASEPRGDAWCGACEEVRLKESDTGDWNESSEAFADITLICGKCYDKVKTLNG